MAKFIQLTTRKIKNLPLDWHDERSFKICLNTDHIVLARPNGAGSGCVMFVDSQCTNWRPDCVDLDASGFEEDRKNVRNTRASMIIVEESYEQVKGMLC